MDITLKFKKEEVSATSVVGEKTQSFYGVDNLVVRTFKPFLGRSPYFGIYKHRCPLIEMLYAPDHGKYIAAKVFNGASYVLISFDTDYMTGIKESNREMLRVLNKCLCDMISTSHMLQVCENHSFQGSAIESHKHSFFD